MAGFKLGFMLHALAMIAALLYENQAYAEPCGGDLIKLFEACKEYILIPGEQKDPSKDCCDVVQHADLPCVCQNIPPGAEKIVSLEKVVYVSKKCDRPIESGTKCGSKLAISSYHHYLALL